MKEVTVNARTVEEAIQQGLDSLGITHEKAFIEVIEEPKKAWLGLIGGKPAVVRVKEVVDPIEKTLDYLVNVLAKMGISAQVKVHQKSNRESIFDLEGEKIAIAIGKRGQTLNALQTLVNLYINQLSSQNFRILLDAEDYRARREESLKGLANRLAAKVIKTKLPVKLEPMPSYERKIIHAELQNNGLVKTASVGEEPYRAVKIELK